MKLKLKLRQVISGVLAFVVTYTSMPLFGAFSAEAGDAPREEWKGYEGRVSFDEWDGTYDTSWYDEYEGTADDPYIINSAEAFAGILTKSVTPNSESTSYYTSTAVAVSDDLDYFVGGTKNALPKNTSSRDKTAWYTFTWPVPFSYTYNVTYTYDTQDIVAGAKEYKHHYVTQVMLNVTINGVSKSIDITDYAKNSFINPEYNTAFNRLDTDYFTGETLVEGTNDLYDVHLSVNELDTAIASIKSNWRWYGPVSEDKLYMYHQGKVTESNMSEDGDYYVSLGSPADYNISFPTVKATNYASGTITINAGNKDDYYLNGNLKGFNYNLGADVVGPTSVASTKTTIKDTTGSIDLALEPAYKTIKFADTTLDTNTAGGTYTTYTNISNLAMEDVYVVQSGTKNYYYWQNASSDKDFDEDEHFYYAVNTGMPGYKTAAYYTYSAKVSMLADGIRIKMTCKDSLGNDVKSWTNTQSFSPGYYNQYKSFYMTVSMNNGVITFQPSLTLAYQTSPTYTKAFPLSSFTDNTVSTTPVTYEAVKDLVVYDENGTEYLYDDIAAQLKFVGRTTTSNTAHKNIVKRNKYLNETLPEILAQNDNPDPTFKGKYFKLTADLDINELAFPYAAGGEVTKTGLSADFDLNGHVIRTNSTLFGNITEYGRLHNGVFTMPSGNANSTIIADNFGEISDISFIPYNAFTMNGDAYTQNGSFLQNNLGLISNVTIVTADKPMLCASNDGVIDGMSVLYTISGFSKSVTGYIINQNTGIIRNVTIDTDRDRFNLEATRALWPAVNVNYGTIDGFVVEDFTVVNNNISYYRPIYLTDTNTILDNLEYYYNDEHDSSYSSILPQNATNNYYTNGNVRYKNLVVKGKHKVPTLACFSNFAIGIWSFKYVNADIDISTPDINNTSLCLLFGSFIDSNIKINGETAPSYRGYSETQSYINLVNSRLSISHVYNDYPYGAITGGWLQDSYIHIGEIKDTVLWGSYNAVESGMKNCIVEIDKAIDFGNSNGFGGIAFTSKQSQYKLISFFDTDIIVHSMEGKVPYGLGGFIKNSRVWFNYAGTLDVSSNAGNRDSSTYTYIEDSEFYFTFDDSATGIVNSFLYGTASASDTLIYVEEMPDAVSLRDATLTGMEFGLLNVTAIAPGINVHPNVEAFGVFGNAFYTGSRTNYFWSGNSTQESINVIAGIHIPDNSNIKSVAGINAITSAHCYSTNTGMYPIIHGINANIDVYDTSGNPADVPVYAINCIKELKDARINNTILRSNTKSPYSALVGINAADASKLLKQTQYDTPLFWNCFMDLPNVPAGSTPSADADYVTPGFIGTPINTQGGFDSEITEENKHYASTIHYTGNIHYSRCYIPENQSFAPKFFSSDPNVTDSWNVNEWLAGNYKTSWTNTEEFDFEAIPEGMTQISSDADKNGELAYMLDKGYAGVRRTYRWSVIEPDTTVYNSFNNEPIYTLPAITWSTGHGIPERCLATDVNLKPVFKTTVVPADDGYIEAAGLNNTTTTDGDVFVKQGSYLINKAEATADGVALIYATQKLGDAAVAKIPSTPVARTYNLRRSVPTEYDISGYKQQGIDTKITPVFKTARYISVDIENSENGTVIPSAYVSAEGEEITVTIEAEQGYIVNNIKINGVPLTESMFFMPDEDVLITGECVPFEGGITKFSLFGINGVIDQIEHTITLDVPKSNYVNNALPVIEYYGDYIVPGTSTRVDFTNPVDYTVFYGDNQSVTYEITVNQSEYTMKIYDFVINGVHGDIDQANKTIKVGLPLDTDLRSLTPDDISYSAETITPDVNTACNFTVSQIYTLYTTNMTPVSYVVDVYTVGEDDAELHSYIVNGYEGVIDQDAGTVTLNVPKGLDLTSVVPDLVTYTGKKISPQKTAPVNLDNNTTYDVISQSDLKKTYGYCNDRFLIELENGTQFTTKICDSKGYADDGDGKYHNFGGSGKCIVEFIYDDYNLPSCVAFSGSWGYYNWNGLDLGANIKSIKKINYGEPVDY